MGGTLVVFLKYYFKSVRIFLEWNKFHSFRSEQASEGFHFDLRSQSPDVFPGPPVDRQPIAGDNSPSAPSHTMVPIFEEGE
jgi:hypothetical protein